jgi:hypothetical protein
VGGLIETKQKTSRRQPTAKQTRKKTSQDSRPRIILQILASSLSLLILCFSPPHFITYTRMPELTDSLLLMDEKAPSTTLKLAIASR